MKMNKITSEKKTLKTKYGGRREILLSIYSLVILFAAMTIYFVYFVATNERELLENDYNSRQQILADKNYRGTIYSKDGDILAETVAGTSSSEKEVRNYPYGKLFSHIIGYSTNGRLGVESLANYYLINSNIPVLEKIENQNAGKKNPGDTVYTTLDLTLQETADNELNIYRGAVVVTEVKTGKILAMVSHPNFDPNNIEQIWERLTEDNTNSDLLNRATQGLYPPGSTFKIVTALEYLKENPETYNDYQFQCNGYYQKDDSKISCYHGTKHGSVDLTMAFAKSCNSAFADIGTKLQLESFQKTLDELLFYKDLPLDLPHAKSSINLPDDISLNELMQTSIGQGKTQITPIHLNMITSAIANRGTLMIPYVIDHIETAFGENIKTFTPQEYSRKLLSEDEALKLQHLMETVVEKGTATKLKGQTYTAAGKTGSAEYNNTKGDSHAWFTGYAPADNPEICLTIIVEGAGSGGDYAVPIARRIFDSYFSDVQKY